MAAAARKRTRCFPPRGDAEGAGVPDRRHPARLARVIRRGGLPLTPVVVVACAVTVLMLAFVERLPCTQSQLVSGQSQLNWGNERPFKYYCYSDVIALYGGDHFDQPGNFPYKTSWVENAGTSQSQVHYVEYPVLTGLFVWGNAQLAGLYSDLAKAGVLPARLAVVVFFYLVALWLAVAWLIALRAVGKLGGGDRRPALLMAISPLVVAQLFTNFDAPAVALTACALLAWSRRRPLLAGVLLGLGGADKLYPLLLLIPLLALCLRAGELRTGGRVLAAAAASWLVVNLPFIVLFPSGWSYFYRFSEMRGPGLESLYNIAKYFLRWSGIDPNLAPNQTPTTVNAISLILFVLACAGVWAIALHARVRPRLPQMCLLVLVAFLLSNKIYSPQYSLWLVPLAVLATPRWKLLVPWMTLDALVWIPTMLFQRQAISATPFYWVVLARDATLLLICAIVIRDIYRPDKDPVARGDDDPCAGPLTGAVDFRRFPLHLRVPRRLASVS
jgi:uncharacterized membrane protein